MPSKGRMKLAASPNNDHNGKKKPTYRKSSDGKASIGKDAGQSKVRKIPPANPQDAKPMRESAEASEKDASSKDIKGEAKPPKGVKDEAKPPKDIKDDAKPSDDAGKSADAKSEDKPDGEAKPKETQKPHSHVAAKKKSRKPLAIGIAAVVVAVIVAVGVGMGLSGNNEASETQDETMLSFSDTKYNDAGELVNPVDWDEWIGRNPDVYAWLQVEDTNVDYPILQHPLVDDYYLMRNIDGEPEVNGTLYTQVGYNTKDFEEDPVTLVYGHTFEQADTMFTTLHNFEDETFFEEHPTFYIYTPDERLEYEVVSAFEYDNSHILMANDMSDPQVRADFFKMVQAPSSINKNVRKLEAELNPDKDKLLILSTCTQPANNNARYLVAAVLKNAESTEDVDVDDDSGVVEEHEISQEELDAMPDVE